MDVAQSTKLLEHLRQRTPAMVDAAARLVGIESPSADLAAVAGVAKETAAFGVELLGVEPEHLDVDGRPHLRWRFGNDTRVVIVGHIDTVWPMGTLARWPFAVDGDSMTGP